jgi:hypothetical protein
MIMMLLPSSFRWDVVAYGGEPTEKGQGFSNPITSLSINREISGWLAILPRVG